MTYSSADRRLHRSTRARAGRKDRRSAAAKAVDNESARRRQRATEVLALDEAAAHYARRLGRDVFRGFVVVAVLGLFLGYLRLMASYGNGPQVNIPLLSTGTALGSSGILAGLITALQVAVRSGAKEAPTARRQFLAKTASVLMLACVGLGTYAGMQFILTAPNVVEPVRMFGPMLGGALLAMLAADAAAAAETLGNDPEANDVVQEKKVEQRRQQYGALARGSTPARKREILRDVAYPVAVAVVTVYMTAAVRGLTGQGSLVLTVATVIYIALCWAVVYLAGICARAGSWVDFGVLAMAATLFACLCGVTLATSALSRSTEITAATNVSWSLAGWTVFNVVAYWTALNAFRTQGARKRRGALLQLAVRRAVTSCARRRGQRRTSCAQARTPWRAGRSR